MFCASMDMSKAFDVVNWKSLFSSLIKRKVRAIFLRLLLYIYEHQVCSVKWGEAYSRRFSVSFKKVRIWLPNKWSFLWGNDLRR